MGLEEVPSARMSTEILHLLCSGRTIENKNCPKKYTQTHGRHTTWDYDDKYTVEEWSSAHLGDFGEFDEYDSYSEDADYVMYEDALNNLNRAEKKFKLATALLNRERRQR